MDERDMEKGFSERRYLIAWQVEFLTGIDVNAQAFPINFLHDLHEKDQIVDLVVVTSMAKTNAEKMKEWREKQRLKDHQGTKVFRYHGIGMCDMYDPTFGYLHS